VVVLAAVVVVLVVVLVAAAVFKEHTYQNQQGTITGVLKMGFKKGQAGGPYLTLPSGQMPARQTPSAEATARAQCASPTDLKVDRTSLKLWQTLGGDASGYHSAYPIEE